MLYSPLYLAGPIITFNYYISQVFLCHSDPPNLATLSFTYHLNSSNNVIWTSVYNSDFIDGNSPSFLLRGRHLENIRLGRFNPISAEYDQLFQSPNNLAQGPSNLVVLA